MQCKYGWLILCLFSIFSWGQSHGAGPAPGQTTIQGIKVKSAEFDSSSRVVKLVFINDSPADITAWGYCIHAQTEPVSLGSRGFCVQLDALPTVIDQVIEAEKRPFLPEPECEGCQVIHPGQEETISSDFSKDPDVTGANIEITMIAYSNGMVENTANHAGLSARHNLTTRREALLRLTQTVLSVGRKILADSTDASQAATMIRALEAVNDPDLGSVLADFKKPKKRMGDEQEFIPPNQRQYVEDFMKDQQTRATMLAKHQIKGAL